MKSNFESCVEEAKKFVAILRLKNVHRMKVAELAMKASVVKHGGRPSLDAPTLRRFAEAIGINPHTLYEWVRYKRYIYDKLNQDLREQYDSTSIARIKNVCVGLPKNAAPKTVQRKFQKEIVLKQNTVKLSKYSAVLNTIIYNCESYRRITQIPDDVLMDYMKKCRMITKYCETALESRGKKIPKNIREPDIDLENFWSEIVGFQ